jgi:hypothetical protein
MKKRIAKALIVLFSIATVIGTTNVSAAEPWQDAYAELLVENMGKQDDHGMHYGYSSMFFIHDLDENGVPELFFKDSIYTFRDGKVNVIGETDVYIQNYFIIPDDRSIEGILFVVNGNGFYAVHDFYNVFIKNGKVVSEDFGSYGNANPEPDVNDRQTKFRIKHGEVSEAEFDLATAGPHIQPYEINSENINTYIYGGNASRHYYTTALLDFKGALKSGESCAAFLIDLDNDGAEEMLTFKSGNTGVDRIQGYITIYDIENGKNISTSFDFTASEGDISVNSYISKTNDIILNVWAGTYADGYQASEIYTYRNGTLTHRVAQRAAIESPDGDFSYKFLFYDKGGELGVEYDAWPSDTKMERYALSETQFASEIAKYGLTFEAVDSGAIDEIQKIAKIILYDNYTQKSTDDDTAKIMALSATGAPTAKAAAPNAVPTPSQVIVDGKTISFDAYNIGGNNYVKLRDIAYALNGTKKQFLVNYGDATKAITLLSGQPYTAVGGEMEGKGSGNKTPTATTSNITLDGEAISLTAYNIAGNNYFMLRDLGRALDFGVTYDETTKAIYIDTKSAYTEE